MGKFAISPALLAIVQALSFVQARQAEAKSSPPKLTQVIGYDAALGELPESIAFNDGRLFHTLFNGQVRELTHAGGSVTVAQVPLPSGGVLTGLKTGPDGLLYATSSGFSPDPDAAFVWQIDPDTGTVAQFASLAAEGFPNDMAFEDDGTMYLVDPWLALIYKIEPDGTPSIFLADPLLAGNPDDPAFPVHEFGVDGVAFDEHKQNLYVANVDYGRVMRIPFGCHRESELEIVAESPELKGIDGIAIDRRGTIYAAVNTQDRIATVDKHGHVTVLVEGAPLDAPSAFAFGVDGWGNHTLYVTNFAINRASAGLPSNPGIYSLPVPVPGSSLP